MWRDNETTLDHQTIDILKGIIMVITYISRTRGTFEANGRKGGGMVTDGGSSKRVGIWINWGVGGGAGELHNIDHLFRSRKRAKGKMPRIQE